jgi:hypothetical protein
MRLIILAVLIFIVACQPRISSFEECVAAGNPVMESFPRQCRAQGKTFIENVTGIKMTEFVGCTEQPEICTAEYDPVCAFVDNNIRCITSPCPSMDAITFGNGCMACADDALGYYPGGCAEQEFVVCGETVTGFSPRKYAEDNNGICVEICPGNHDSYVTQTGIGMSTA